MAGLPMKRAIGCVDRSPPYFVLVPCGAPTPHWGFGYDGSARLTSVSLVWSVLCTQGPDESVFFVSCVPETLFVCFFSFFKPAKTRARPGISLLLHPPPSLSLFRGFGLLFCRSTHISFHLPFESGTHVHNFFWKVGGRGHPWERLAARTRCKDPQGSCGHPSMQHHHRSVPRAWTRSSRISCAASVCGRLLSGPEILVPHFHVQTKAKLPVTEIRRPPQWCVALSSSGSRNGCDIVGKPPPLH